MLIIHRVEIMTFLYNHACLETYLYCCRDAYSFNSYIIINQKFNLF